MHKRPPKAALLSAVLLSALALLFLAGCSTIPKAVLQSDPSDKLERMPEVYARLINIALRDILDNLSDQALDDLVDSFSKGKQPAADGYAVDRRDLDDLVNRTKVLGLGLSGVNSKSPRAEAVLIGNFPVHSMKFALSAKGKWTKIPSGYQSKEASLFIRPLEQGLLHAATFPQEGASNLPPVSGAMPPRFKNMRSDFAVVVNSPEILLNFPALSDGSAIPISEIVIQGTRKVVQGDAKVPAQYLLDVYIVMKDANAAKMYKPAVRLLWAFSGERYLGGISTSGAQLVLENDTYKAEGIAVGPQTLVDLLSQFAGAPDGDV